jgi:site-specific recombinase XerC
MCRSSTLACGGSAPWRRTATTSSSTSWRGCSESTATAQRAIRTGGCSRRGPARPLAIETLSRARWPPAAQRAGLEDSGWPPLRFHDLRHTFSSHLIVDLGLDVAQVSRIMGHASVTITLNVYTHLFDDARHGKELLARMGASRFAALLEPPPEGPTQVRS